MSEIGFWKNSSLHVILGGVIVASVAAIAFAFLVEPESRYHTPADPRHPRWAVMHEPEQVAHRTKHKQPYRKTRGPILTELSSDLPGLPVPGAPFKLRGTVTLKEDVAELHYKFDLPLDIKIVSGDLSGVIYNARAADTHEIEVTVETRKSADLNLRFRSWKMSGREPIGNTANLVFAEQRPEALQAAGIGERFPSAEAPRSIEEFKKRAVH